MYCEFSSIGGIWSAHLWNSKYASHVYKVNVSIDMPGNIVWVACFQSRPGDVLAIPVEREAAGESSPSCSTYLSHKRGCPSSMGSLESDVGLVARVLASSSPRGRNQYGYIPMQKAWIRVAYQKWPRKMLKLPLSATEAGAHRIEHTCGLCP